MRQDQLTDQMLEEAMTLFSNAMLASLPQPAECGHVFSPEFEKKMDRLLKKAKKPKKAYSFLKRAAVIFLTIILSAATWLTVDQEARAAFIQWTREHYENTFLYRYFGSIPDETIPQYHIPSLSQGYELTSYLADEGMKIAVFTPNEGESILFAYYYIQDGYSTIITAIGNDMLTQEPVDINGIEGTFYDYADAETSDSLFWIDDTMGIAFEIQSVLDKETMVELARSVKPGQIKTSFSEYSLSWIPEEYHLIRCEGSVQSNSQLYKNGTNFIEFEAFNTSEDKLSAAFEIETAGTITCKINRLEGLFISADTENTLLWMDPETSTAFSLTAAENMEIMIDMAESVDIKRG